MGRAASGTAVPWVGDRGVLSMPSGSGVPLGLTQSLGLAISNESTAFALSGVHEDFTGLLGDIEN